MNNEDVRIYCISKPGVTESFPFDDVTLVFKVMNKMFALMSIDSPQLSLNLKCDPDLAIELREQYSGVRPGYHMNKQLWNTVVADGSFSVKQLLQWIDNSYNLIVASLPKKLKEELKNINPSNYLGIQMVE